MPDFLLHLDIISGPVVFVVFLLAVGSLVALLVRRPNRVDLLRAALGMLLGAAVGLAALIYTSVDNTFGVDLSTVTGIWGVAALAAVGFAVSTLFMRSRWWRRVVAGFAIVAVQSAGVIGINQDFGLNRTLGDLVGVDAVPTIALPVATPHPTRTATLPLWQSWAPPADQPATGQIGSVVIPSTISGFSSRPAGIYLPPAALVKNPPALPLMIMMMGQPGNPDPIYAGQILNGFAARHHGLAPIVLVADQIGNPSVDPLCLDTAAYGNAETFITKDVVAWARAKLNVLQTPAAWTVAGYSNGGECALYFGAKYPTIWGNVLDISGEAYPGSDATARTLSHVFHGDQAAYDAVKPVNILAAHQYLDQWGVFTVGSNDGRYVTQAKQVSAAAKAAGWTTTYFEVPNGGHVLGALNGGLTEGFTVLYPRLGLSDPAAAP